MALDTSFYGNMQPVKVADPLEQAGKFYTLQSAMQQSQLGQQKLADDAALRQAAAEAGGDPRRLRDALMSRGQVSAALAIDKDIATRDKEQRAAEQADIARKAERAKYWRDQLATVGPDNYAQFIQSARAEGAKFAENAPPQFDPKWQQQNLMTADKFLERAMPKLHIANEGGMGGVGRDPYTGAMVSPGEPLLPTPSAEQRAPQTRNRIVGENLVQEEYQPASGTWKQVGAGPRFGKQVASAEPGTTLDDAAIEQAAARYSIDGSLPTNLGRGVQGAVNTAAILNRSAAQMAESGESPEGVRVRQLANRASTQALGQLVKQKNLILAFENNAVRNADLVLDRSEKVDRLGSPVIDRWLQAGKKNVQGDSSVAELDAAMRTFVNEYARVTTTVTGGGVTSDAARKEIDALLRSANTKEQVRNVVNLMKQEMGNRRLGYEDQEKTLKASITTGAAPSPAPSSTGSPPRRIKFDAQGNVVP